MLKQQKLQKNFEPPKGKENNFPYIEFTKENEIRNAPEGFSIADLNSDNINRGFAYDTETRNGYQELQIGKGAFVQVEDAMIRTRLGYPYLEAKDKLEFRVGKDEEFKYSLAEEGVYFFVETGQGEITSAAYVKYDDQLMNGLGTSENPNLDRIGRAVVDMTNSMNIVAYDRNGNEVKPNKISSNFETAYENNRYQYYEWQDKDNPSIEYEENLKYSEKLDKAMKSAKSQTLAANLIKSDKGLANSMKANIQSNKFPTFGGEKPTQSQLMNL